MRVKRAKKMKPLSTTLYEIPRLIKIVTSVLILLLLFNGREEKKVTIKSQLKSITPIHLTIIK